MLKNLFKLIKSNHNNSCIYKICNIRSASSFSTYERKMSPNAQKKLMVNYRKKFIYEDVKPDYLDNQPKIEYLNNEQLQKLFENDEFINPEMNILENLGIKKNVSLNLITEGKLKFLAKMSNSTKSYDGEEQETYYYPGQEFNRDLTLFILKTYAQRLKKEQNENFKGIKILDALSVSGATALRISQEINPELIELISINHPNEHMYNIIKKNMQINHIDHSYIKVIKEDPNDLMFKSRNSFWTKIPPLKYDFIEIDPNGSIIPYLDTAVQAIADGGLISCVCSDLPIISGLNLPKCFNLYGVSSTKMEMHKENSIRIVLHAINVIANRYSRSIKPIFSYHTDQALKLYFTVNASKAECSRSIVKNGNVYYCVDCDNYHIHNLGRTLILDNNASVVHRLNKLNIDLSKCNQCGGSYVMNGPIWLDEINDYEFVQNLYDQLHNPKFDLDIQSKKKIFLILDSILSEKETRKYPFGVNLDKIGKLYKTSVPNRDILKYLIKKHGFMMQGSYMYPKILKTNAPLDFFYDLMKAWKIYEMKKRNEDITSNIDPSSQLYANLKKPLKYNIDFNSIRFISNNHKPNTTKEKGDIIKDRADIAKENISINKEKMDNAKERAGLAKEKGNITKSGDKKDSVYERLDIDFEKDDDVEEEKVIPEHLK